MVSNKDKREFFELLYRYFSMKPKSMWCVDVRDNYKGQHCALGFTDQDFNHMAYVEGGLYDRENPVTAALLKLTKNEKGFGIVVANNGKYSYEINEDRDGLHPKDRVLLFLESQIKSL